MIGYNRGISERLAGVKPTRMPDALCDAVRKMLVRKIRGDQLHCVSLG